MFRLTASSFNWSPSLGKCSGTWVRVQDSSTKNMDVDIWNNPHPTVMLKGHNVDLLRFILIRNKGVQITQDNLQLQGNLLSKLLLQTQGDY